MSVLDCLKGQLTSGKITQRQHDDAERVYNGIVGDLYNQMPRATAEAHAALETARILEDGAKARRYALAKTAVAYAEGLQRVEQHPDNAIAGFMGILDRDIRERGGINVSSVAQDYEGRMADAMHAVEGPYRSTRLGTKQDKAGIRDMIREVFGVDTRNPVAKEAAAGWKKVDEFATSKAKQLGKVFSPAEDWRLPQWWESGRVTKFGRSEFIRDVSDAVNAGGLKIFDAETGTEATGLRRGVILDGAADKIIADSSTGAGGGAFRNDMRVFRFTDGEPGSDAYLKLMDKYGAGQGGYLAMMQGHVGKVSRELGLLHVLGPDYRATGEALLGRAKELAARAGAEPATGTFAQRFRAKAGTKSLSLLGLEGPVAADRLLRYQTGQLSGAESELMAGIVGGARAFMTSSSMGSAVLTAVPADTVNWMMAANHIGMDMGKLAARVSEAFLRDTPQLHEEAARLGIVAHASADAAIGTKRFSDQVLGDKFMQRMADTVIRAQGLHAWDSAIKRAFTMEFLGTIAQRANTPWAALDEPFRNFLEHYRFTPDEWSVLARDEHHVPIGEARFLMPDSLPDDDLRTKLMSAVYDERQFAYLAQGSARVKANATGGVKGGTLAGEAARSFFLFKSFAVSMMATWGMRAATQGSMSDKLFVTAQLGTFLTMAGALSMQARSVLQGKDPRNMKDPWFWGESALTGGALGIYGDFFKEAFSRSGTSLTETALGPLAAIPSSIQRLTSGARRAAESGEHVNFGSALADDIAKFTPGGNLWYTRLLLNRYLYDNIRRGLDPDAAGAFARQKERARKTSGQDFWFSPGASAPDRAPNLGAVAGTR